MLKISDKTKCNGCSACAKSCPQKCIKMVSDNEGFLYPQVDETLCIKCGKCLKICPQVHGVKLSSDTKVYAAINKDSQVRMKSSSGGVFSILSEYILSVDGVVYGASFNEKLELLHIGIDRIEGIDKLRGAKYLQSNLNEIFNEVKVALEKGRKVLFSGTPCQVGGLKAFLEKDYENLYTQDLICHGVPSPKVWSIYLKQLGDKYNSKVTNVFFRNKKNSWKKYEVEICFESGEKLLEVFTQNSYMQAFLKNLCLRPSCYDCNFKGVERCSDFTVADFWGVESYLPQMDDDKGTSLVFVHSEKGRELLKTLEEKLIIKEIPIDDAIAENSSAIKSSSLPKKRDQFMREVNKKDFNKLVYKHMTPNFFHKIASKMKKLIKIILGRN